MERAYSLHQEEMGEPASTANQLCHQQQLVPADISYSLKTFQEGFGTRRYTMERRQLTDYQLVVLRGEDHEQPPSSIALQGYT